MRPLKRGIAVAASLALGSLLLTACTGGDDVEMQAPSKDFIIGWSEVDGIDTIQTKSDAGIMVAGNVYAPLIEQVYTEADGYLDGTSEFTSLLADVDVSEDGTVYTFAIKPEAKFADGEPITADDVIFTMQRTLNPDASYVAGSSRIFMHISDTDTQIVKIDDSTVQLTLDAPSAAVEHFLALNTFGIMEKSVVEAGATADDPAAKKFVFTNPVASSGPFTVSEWTDQKLVLTKNPNYIEAGDVYADSVTVQNIADSDQRLLAVLNGDIDVAFGLSPRQIEQAAKSDAVDVVRIPSSSVTYVGMNNAIAPFDNVTFRQAIASAIPYQEILDEVMLGTARADYGAVPYGMETSLAPDDETGMYDTDLDLAEQLLAESGVDSPTLTLTVNSSRQQDIDAATLVQASLAKIGVTVNIEQLSSSDYTTRKGAKELSFFFDSWFSWGEDPFYQMRALFLTDRATNPTQYANPALDEAVLAGIDEVDPDARQELSATAQQLLMDEAPAAWLYTTDQVVVVKKGVTGISAGDDLQTRLKFLSRTS